MTKKKSTKDPQKKKAPEIAGLPEEEELKEIMIPEDTFINLDMTREAKFQIVVTEDHYDARFTMSDEIMAFAYMVVERGLKNMIEGYKRKTPEERKIYINAGRSPKADILTAESFIKHISGPTIADLIGKIYNQEKKKEMAAGFDQEDEKKIDTGNKGGEKT